MPATLAPDRFVLVLAAVGLIALAACREESKVCRLDGMPKGDELKPLDDPDCKGKVQKPA